MPKETFMNLPIEKKEMIEAIALTEFANYSYDKASINRIIKEAGIAKGSFYQYFEDKKDIYKYLLKKVVEEKINYLSPIFHNLDAHDFFALIKEMYISALEFARAHPEFVAIGNRLIADKNHPIYIEIMDENMNASYDIFAVLIQKAIDRKEVRADIDIKFMSYFISAMNIIMAEYYKDNVGTDIDESILKYVDKLTDFIKHGIAINKEEC